MDHPTTDRPDMPGYGISTDDAGMLDWPWVSRAMQSAKNYWIITTRPDSLPHASPVWGLWVDEVFYFSCGRKSQKARNIATNPNVVVHLESGDEVVILEGTLKIISDIGIFPRLSKEYKRKYDFDPFDENGGQPNDPFYALKVRKAYAWREKDFPKSATRWRFS
jgi:Pyridoxamine 5'-phosphate oxidase